MSENEIAKVIVDAAFQVHTKLGPGLLESVYEVVLAAVLRRRGLQVERQVPVLINFGAPLIRDGITRLVNRLME
jgi:GxxExxY protein